MLKEQTLLLNVIEIITSKYNEILEENKFLVKKLKEKALYDPLTHLLNRDEFFNRLKTKRNFCLLFIDLDNFKEANDTYGHEIGDKILVEFANLLKNFFKGKDLIGRIGGDEFIVAVMDCNKEKVKSILKNLLLEIKNHFKSYNITASIGAGFYPDDNKNIEAVIKIADERMYKIKKSKKNGFCIE